MIVQGILQWSEQKFTFEKILSELIAKESGIALRELDRQDKWNPEIQFVKRKVQCKSCLKFGYPTSKCRKKDKPAPLRLLLHPVSLNVNHVQSNSEYLREKSDRTHRETLDQQGLNK